MPGSEIRALGGARSEKAALTFLPTVPPIASRNSGDESHLYELVTPIGQVRAVSRFAILLLLKIDREFDVIGGGVDDDFKIAVCAALIARGDKALAWRTVRRRRNLPA